MISHFLNAGDAQARGGAAHGAEYAQVPAVQEGHRQGEEEDGVVDVY